ncbi:flagellar filament capping protein FliD [Venatoribacter cucullus]|uniref:flagellar filament capping protein FliD n=1 Tax=Venatoribacter cucullus TaxID=2661630 RepID=UPI0022400141|nr:flagellar filament capping protein FliD [Venatoribacter cucullus]UZK04097.1 flagellar filament capping protein FliD [Venatoribacter cucullus]
MASIQSLGLGSGVLTTDLVEKLVNAEREVAELRLNNRQELTEAKITAYGEIKSQMSKIQTAAGALSSPSLMGATIVTSSDESVLTATGSATADPGTYNVEVLNTAKSHALATDSYASFDEIIGTGKLVFTFGELSYGDSDNITGQTVNPGRASKTITIDDSNRTLSGIRDAINKADMGVTATIVNDGNGYRLLMNSSDTGVKNAIRIEAQDAAGNALSGGLGAFAFNENQVGSGLTQTSKGEDAELQVNGLPITRASNTVDEVIKGVTLNLKSADEGKNISINVSPDTEALTESIDSFITAYNDLKSFVDDLSKFDPSSNVGGLLMGDSTIRTMMSQVRALISEPIVGLTGKYRSLTELGVNTDRNNDYLLTFDKTAFSKALNEDRSALIGLLAKTGTTTDSQITYVNDSINTKPGTYDVNITQLATQAKYTAGSLALLDFSSEVIIDDSNNNFSINVNGQTAAVELTKGSYKSGEELAAQLALQINSNESLSKFGHSVSVEYNATDKNFSFTSNKYGSESQVYFTSVDANTANTLGFNTLGAGTYKGVGLTTLGAEAFTGKGASTLPGNRAVAADAGINFATSNASFSLDIGGGSVAVTVSQNAAGTDLNGDGVFGDRNDTLQAIQNALDNTAGLAGAVTASFDKNGFLTFTTNAIGAAQRIEITDVGTGTGTSTSDVLLGLRADQGPVTNGKNAGLTLGSPIEFNVQVDGITTATKVSVPAGTYLTGDDLATEIQNQISASLAGDASFADVIRGASTATGTRDISAVDFSTTNAGFRLNVSGVEKEIIVTGSDLDPLVNIQAALDAAYDGARVVTATLDGGRLKLSSVATGYQQYIEVAGDGRGARSSSFANLSSGIDFSGANYATFDLTVAGVTLKVNVNGDGTSGGSDSASNLAVIQQALDTALTGSGQFAAGDVQAKVDDSGKLYFETLAKNGVRTAATFGSAAQLKISNVAGNTALGLSAETTTNGYDGFGLTTNSRTFGYSLDAAVSYNYDPDTKLGSFDISIGGNATQVGFTDLDSAAVSFLGLQDASLYSPEIPKGKDVAGTINGVEASGTGQFLRAVDGNAKATNGFYLGNTATDFSTAVVLNDNNSTFKISVDGTEAEVTLNYPASYNSGATLAAVLEKAINDTAAFKDKNLGVKVEYTDDPTSFANGKFGIISASTGAQSEVRITEANAEVAAVFGFVTGIGDGAKGKAQVGEVDAASGLRLKVTGGNVGSRGSVTYVSGFGDRLKDIMDGFLNGQNSVIAGRERALDTEVKNIGEDRERMEIRLAASEARLRASFLFNDAIISTLNTTLDYVKQQFEAMANSKK